MDNEQVTASQTSPMDVRGEIDHPTYRVYFDVNGAQDEWRLQTCRSVHDALEWANQDGRPYYLYVETYDPSDLTLIQLAAPGETRS